MNLVSGSYHRTSYSPREISFLWLSVLHQLSYSQDLLTLPFYINILILFLSKQLTIIYIFMYFIRLIGIVLWRKNQLAIITLLHVN